jgi:hypothetical protein
MIQGGFVEEFGETAVVTPFPFTLRRKVGYGRNLAKRLHVI